MAFKMKNQSMAKLTKAAGDSRVAMKMKAESAMKKELVGKQGNLPPELKAKIEAAPSKMKSAMKKNGDDAKIKALQDRLAKAMKEGNDREISAIRSELQQLYKVEKKAKDNSPTKMKEKSAMKKDLPEVRITGKKEEKKKGPNKVTKDLKYPYSKNKFGDLTYKGDIIDKKEAAKIKDSDLYEYNPVKPTKKGNSAVPMKSAMKKDNRSFFQKAKDEAKQIGKGLKSGILELDNIGSGEHTGKSIKPVKAFKRAYKEEENKQAKKRKAGSQSLTKKN